MANLYHLGLALPPLLQQTRSQQIDRVLNSHSIEWVRYSYTGYILYTGLNAQGIYGILQPFISQAEQVFISRIDPNDRFGFLPQWIWNWIDQKRGPQNPLLNFTGFNHLTK